MSPQERPRGAAVGAVGASARGASRVCPAIALVDLRQPQGQRRLGVGVVLVAVLGGVALQRWGPRAVPRSLGREGGGEAEGRSGEGGVTRTAQPRGAGQEAAPEARGWVWPEAGAVAVIERRRVREGSPLAAFLGERAEGCTREVLAGAERVWVVSEGVPLRDWVVVAEGPVSRDVLVGCARAQDPAVRVETEDGVTLIAAPSRGDAGLTAVTAVLDGAVMVGPVAWVARLLRGRRVAPRASSLGPVWALTGDSDADTVVRAAWRWGLPATLTPWDAITAVSARFDTQERVHLALRCRDPSAAVRLAARMQDPDAGAPVRLDALRVEGEVVLGTLRSPPSGLAAPMGGPAVTPPVPNW